VLKTYLISKILYSYNVIIFAKPIKIFMTKKITECLVEIKELTPAETRDALKKSMDTIVGNIDKIMGEKKITQENLAYGIGSSQPHLNYILRKKKGITIKVLSRIAKVLDVKLYELVK